MLIMNNLRLIIVLLFIAITQQYSRSYYENGSLKSEGWKENDKPVKYWFYYYLNGKIKAEGHYDEGFKNDYWYYYDRLGQKFEEGNYEDGFKEGWWKMYKQDTIIELKYKNSLKTGLAIYKVDDNPVKAEYYKNDIKTNEWFNLRDFKREYLKVND